MEREIVGWGKGRWGDCERKGKEEMENGGGGIIKRMSKQARKNNRPTLNSFGKLNSIHDK